MEPSRYNEVWVLNKISFSRGFWRHYHFVILQIPYLLRISDDVNCRCLVWYWYWSCEYRIYEKLHLNQFNSISEHFWSWLNFTNFYLNSNLGLIVFEILTTISTKIRIERWIHIMLSKSLYGINNKWYQQTTKHYTLFLVIQFMQC